VTAQILKSSKYTWRILRISHERHIFEFLNSWIQNFNKNIALFTSDIPVNGEKSYFFA
jgi:hypothetical protein